MIVVVDANILISDHLGEGVCRRVVDYLIENHTLALSQYILDETSRKFCGKVTIQAPPDPRRGTTLTPAPLPGRERGNYPSPRRGEGKG